MRDSSVGDHGVSDIPMRLIIAAVITSLSLPIFWGAYDSLSENMTLSSVEGEIGELLRVVEDVMSGGTGSTLDAEISFNSWGTSDIEYVKVGGPLENGNASSLKIEYSISGVGTSFLSLDPPLRMCSSKGGSLFLQEGKHQLRVVNRMFDGVPAAEVEKMD
ncbi:MAG: hypothetical protein R6V01_08475 [Thermoplasmatota archaeon]